MAESTRHPSEQDDSNLVKEVKLRIQVTNLDKALLNEYLFVDWLRGGRCRIVGQYNIPSVPEDRENPDGTTTQMWVFDEGSLVWTPPPFYEVDGITTHLDLNSRTEVEAFVAANSFELIEYIKRIPVSW